MKRRAKTKESREKASGSLAFNGPKRERERTKKNKKTERRRSLPGSSTDWAFLGCSLVAVSGGGLSQAKPSQAKPGHEPPPHPKKKKNTKATKQELVTNSETAYPAEHLEIRPMNERVSPPARLAGHDRLFSCE